MTILSDEIERLNRLPEDIRKQAKFDHIVALMQGETGNFSAGVYVSVLASFAIATMNTGFDPLNVLVNLRVYAAKEVKRLLAEQGISAKVPKRLDG